MKQFVAVFEHIANYLTNIELQQLLSMDEFTYYNTLFNKINKFNTNNFNTLLVIQNGHNLQIESNINKYIDNFSYYPEIFSLKLTKVLCDFTQFNNIHELNLNCIKLKNTNVIKNISNIKRLEKLTINFCYFNLKNIVKYKYNFLKILEINKTITNFTKFLSFFIPTNFPVLESFSLINVNFDSYHNMETLCNKLNQIKSITHLDFSKNDFSNGVDSDFFYGYKNFNNLLSLRLDYCNLDYITISCLYNRIKKNNFQKIKKLSLNGNILFDNNTRNLYFIEIITYMKLEELYISNTNIPESLIYIISSISLPYIKKLEIYNCHIKEHYKNLLESNYQLIENINCKKCFLSCYHIISK